MMNVTDKAILYEAAWRELAAGLAMQVITTRMARGWTREELATRSGLPVTMIVSIEQGRLKRVTMGHWAKFAVAFGVDVHVWLDSWPAAIKEAMEAMQDAEKEAGK